MGAFFEDYLERIHTLCEDFAATFADLSDEALDWQPGPDMNSLTVLVTHTTCSARYWIGDVALGEPSHRDRAAEFESAGLSTAELTARLDALEG